MSKNKSILVVSASVGACVWYVGRSWLCTWWVFVVVFVFMHWVLRDDAN